MSDHFYLTLPSDSSVAYYPENTIARYVTKLPERIRLDGDYEVGLSEIAYPHTWYNVDNEDERYWIGAFNIVTNEFLISKVSIKSGYYGDGDAFASSLTHQTTRAFADIPDISVKFTFVEHIDRIRMRIQNSNDTIVVLSSELLEFLGFRRKLMVTKDMDLNGSVAFDVNRGLNLMYVYCDIAADSTVGDIKAPLLRVCNVSGEHGRVVHVTYVRPHYVPVGRREFDTVEIAINNELGKPMPFEFGKSVVTLHFRRR
jgi:hypothetical protein